MSELTCAVVLSCGAAYTRASCVVPFFRDGGSCVRSRRLPSHWRRLAPYAHSDPREGGREGGGHEKKLRGCATASVSARRACASLCCALRSVWTHVSGGVELWRSVHARCVVPFFRDGGSCVPSRRLPSHWRRLAPNPKGDTIAHFRPLLKPSSLGSVGWIPEIPPHHPTQHSRRLCTLLIRTWCQKFR